MSEGAYVDTFHGTSILNADPSNNRHHDLGRFVGARVTGGDAISSISVSLLLQRYFIDRSQKGDDQILR